MFLAELPCSSLYHKRKKGEELNTVQAGSGHLAIKLTSIVRSCNSFGYLLSELSGNCMYFKGDTLFQCLSFMGVFIDGFVDVHLLCFSLCFNRLDICTIEGYSKKS